MKQCPRCKQTYSDPSLNFCLEDGELLTTFSHEPPPARYADDTPPTILLDQSRVTNPTNWPHQPAAQPPMMWQQPGMQAHPVGHPALRSQDKTLPTIALILGILGLPMCWCGWLGLPAAICGFLGMRNADRDPGRYGGRGMAVAGLVMGVISMLVFLVFIIIAAASGG